jgi:hypothetical protein
MSIQIDELTTKVDVVAAATSEAAASQRAESSAERERARRAAERAVWIARRVCAEGYDD